jgi:ATP-dependent RNA helicase DDX24/MAK5
MDRFRKSENSLLIATDVAARGLDIPNIRTVIHYQLPHSAEVSVPQQAQSPVDNIITIRMCSSYKELQVYVHRSGRTARASNDGCSIMFVSPTDQMKYNALCCALSKVLFYLKNRS